MHKRGRRKGISLIEMLVVVAIILILATIATPVVGSMAGRAKGISCKSNLRAIMQGSVAYSNSEETSASLYRFHNATVDAPHEGSSGYAREPDYPGNPAVALFHLGQYVTTPETFFCPTVNLDPKVHFDPFPLNNPGTYWGSYIYWYPHVLAADEMPPRMNSRNSKRPMPVPAQTVAITDMQKSYWEGEGFRMGWEHYNAGFEDGHVEQVARTEADFKKWIYD